jgi:hypothetical protein
MNDGTQKEFGPGDAYHVPPGTRWVVGDEPFVSIEVAPEEAAGFAKGGSSGAAKRPGARGCSRCR